MIEVNRKAGAAMTAPCLTLCLILAACSSPPARDAGNMATPDKGVEAANAVDATAVANDTDAPTKSILRPDVAHPEPEEPALQPVDTVLAFDARGTAMTEDARRALDDIVAGPVFQAGGTVTLRGHSDTRGSDRANLAASRKRAEAVRDYLVGKGVDPARLTVIALGETSPLVPNAHPDGSDDPEARARNRRVEIHVALPPSAPAPDAAPMPPENATAPTVD